MITDTDRMALHLQTQEFQVTHSLSNSDIDLAFHLQLNEALASSLGLSSLHHHPPSTSSTCIDDFKLAVDIQANELQRAEQEFDDGEHAARKSHHLAQTLNQTAHDGRIAQTLADMADNDRCKFCEEQGARKDGLPSSLELCFKGESMSWLGFGNEKIVGIGVVLVDDKGKVVWELGKQVDSSLTGLSAHYAALIEGLSMAHSMGARRVRAFGMSRALHKQIAGTWTKSRKIHKLWQEAMAHISAFDGFKLAIGGKKRMERPTKLAEEAILFMPDKEITASRSMKEEQCTICLDDKEISEVCTIISCRHRYCRSCIARHAELKISTGQVPVLCPESDCNTTITVEELKPLLSSKTLDLLLKRLLEASIPEADRMYCPFPNCSALMVKGTIKFSMPASSSNVRPSTGPVECVDCKRLFCAECRVPWHKFKTCDEYQNLAPQLRDAEDAKLYELAKNKQWKRCRECKCMIELAEGCFHMTCRCGYEFCYVCGAPWIKKQATCKCKLWDEENLIREPFSDSESEDLDYDEFVHYDEDDFTEEDDMSIGYVPFVPFFLNPWKTKLCIYFQAGYCRNGDFCTFAHGEDDLRTT